MKITPTKVADFLTNLPNFRVALLHGPDRNKIAALHERIVASFADADVQKISLETMKNQPNFLYEAIFAIDWLQSQAWKVLILEDFAGDVELFKKENWPNVFVIIFGKNINNKSAIFKFADKEKNCATIGCYSDYENQGVLRKILTEMNLQCDANVLKLLQQKVPIDEQIIRSELSKLEKIIHPRTAISPEDLAAITNYEHNEMMNLAVHFSNLDFPNFERCAHELHSAGENPISLLYILYNFCEKLFLFKSSENQASRNVVCKKYNIFFKLVPILKRNKWLWEVLSMINGEFLQLEIDLKSGQDLDYFVVKIRILIKQLKKIK